jgi:hypothetical protein
MALIVVKEFNRLFLREPIQEEGEGGIIITVEQLQTCAGRVWRT